jgi:hypothetical protein
VAARRRAAAPLRPTGTFYCAGGAWKLAPGAAAWVAETTVHTVRFPNAFDPDGRTFFGLVWSDGQNFGGDGLTALFNDLKTGTSLAITFHPSDALTQLTTDRPEYAAMDYDPINHVYLFYDGLSHETNSTTTNVPNRLYVITPNATASWDIGFFALAANSVTPANVPGSAISGRFKYVPRLKGFVMMPSQSANLFFLRTAP